MGIDYDGGMIVGRNRQEVIDVLEERNKDNEEYDVYEDIEDAYFKHDMTSFSEYYDADADCCFIGFSIKDEWDVRELDELKQTVIEKAALFEEVFGMEASLRGMQSIY